MQRKKIEKVYIQKINKLKKYDKAYFDQDNPVISDKDYDKLKNELLDFEKKHKYLKHKDSPSQKVGYKPSEKFKKVEHDIPMLSLANAFSKENVEEFLKKIKNFLNMKDSEKIIFSEPCTFKKFLIFFKKSSMFSVEKALARDSIGISC